jgi:transposase
MNCSLLRLAVLLCFAAPAFGGAAADTAAAHDRLQSIAQRAFELLWQFHPVDATRIGFHKYDDRLGDYTPARVKAVRQQVDRFIVELDRLDTTGLSPDDRIDRLLLGSNLRMELFWLERRRLLVTNPCFYADECIQGVYSLLLREFAPLERRAGSVAARMADVPRFIDVARRNVKNPPRLFAAAAVERLRSGEELYAASASELGRSFPALKPRLDSASEVAVAAMRSWRSELEPMLSRLRAGFAMGRADYDYLLETDKFLSYDADSLLCLGERLLAQTEAEMGRRIAVVGREIKAQLSPDPRAELLMTIPGVGVLIAYLLLCEIGEIGRFLSAKKLCAYGGIVPAVRQSADHLWQGRITKEGSRYIRWAMVEAACKAPSHDVHLGRFYRRLALRRGPLKARVAVARKLLAAVWYLLTYNEPYKPRYETAV